MDSTLAGKLWAAVAALAMLSVCAAAAPSAHGAGYVRPKGATPLRSPMVPVYERCESNGGRHADTTHGLPLNYLACRDPELISGTLTFGTPDVNNKGANAVGAVVYTVIPGKPSTPVDEADVRIDFSLTDVRLQGSLVDYTGQLELSLESRITDSANGPAQDEPGTMEDFFYTATVPCTATADPAIGGTCALHTTADTLAPDTIKEGKRTIWEQADHTHIFDGGTDWTASTEDDNLLFATQGLFIP